MNDLKQQIIDFAKSLDFDLVAFTTPEIPPKAIEHYQNWLEKKHHADMSYMEKAAPRNDLFQILPNIKTVICLATNYYYPQKDLKKDHARIARFAYGRDYHKVLKKKLQKIEEFIKEKHKDAQTKSFVDTGPVLERCLAEKAGLGVISKNSCLITQQFGSWVFLSEIFTTVRLQPDKSKFLLSKDFSYCGACQKCIQSCPTGAIVSPGVIDSRKCLAYNTIENKGEIADPIQKSISKTQRAFGCDICQEVCPHNIKNAKEHQNKELKKSKIAGNQIDIKENLSIKDDQEYLKKYAGSPLMRAKRKGLQRNLSCIQSHQKK